jgi:Uma2 family endonuclease
MTPAEYLELERKAEYKSEYIAGRMYAMSGVSRRHSLIAGNLHGEIGTQLRGRNCEVHIALMRVKVSPSGLYTYPDVVAVCGEARFEDAEVDTLINPTVIIEVLSPSTEAYDRGQKFEYCRKLETLREYVLVAQDRLRIEHYRRRDGSEWVLTEIKDPDGMLDLPSIDCHVAVSAIYEKIEFDPELPPERRPLLR